MNKRHYEHTLPNIRGSLSNTYEESLQRKLARLESALDTERARLRKACDKIPWGAGMRRTKCTPSFRRENELIEKIKVVKLQLSQMRTVNTLAGQ